jgi:hypothetical protein
LLPQLTDVLYALTDSQELLLGKLRSVRLEHRCGEHSSIDESQDTEAVPETVRRGPALVPLTTAETVDDRDASPTREIGDADRPIPIWLGPTESNATRDATTGFAPDAVNAANAANAANASDIAAPSPVVTQPVVVAQNHHMDAAASTQSAIPSVDSSAEHPEAPADEPSDRNYNFFDELDAKLTSLSNPESNPGDH